VAESWLKCLPQRMHRDPSASSDTVRSAPTQAQKTAQIAKIVRKVEVGTAAR
jgi:hypothetical protein